MTLSVRWWGTRGSIPTPGADTVRYGGNTPCVAVSAGTDTIILDAGTGIRVLGRELVSEEGEAPQRLTVLLSHTHWDHIQGLPFFAPLYRAGNHITILGPRQPGPSLESVIHGQMAPAVFPVPAAALASRLEVSEIDPGEHEIGGFSVRAMTLCHPGATLGYAIAPKSGGPRFSYLTDNELGAAGPDQRRQFVRFLQGSDTLAHDAMYFDAELAGRVGWGHSSAAEAVGLALEAGVRRLVLFHHAPSHDDATLERLLEEAERSRVRHGGSLDVTIAAEGHSLRC
ncbi:MAG: MBL fold metallo-hydrolase [Gemmatimonadales bacterium]|nr:MBL fold metallo-hydrolase [Gemmatimonadales bacterium]